jgi:hypothetical protein
VARDLIIVLGTTRRSLKVIALHARFTKSSSDKAARKIPQSTFVAAVPAKVLLLNPQPALTLDGGNRSSCPEADLTAAHGSPESDGKATSTSRAVNG